MVLESMKHASSLFVTLTYSEEHLPPKSSLVPIHMTLWIKRLRKVLSPIKFRYYLVGEYGEQTQRPHYHAALFGLDIDSISLIEASWSYGNVHFGDLTENSAAYVAGYITKKIIRKEEYENGGRIKEFARMSLRPGIGALAVDEIAKSFENPHVKKLIADLGDVPSVLFHGKKSMPLGRYLRGKIRETLQVEPDQNKTLKNVVLYTSEMRFLLAKALKKSIQEGNTNVSISQLHVEITAGRRASVLAKHKIKQGSPLI